MSITYVNGNSGTPNTLSSPGLTSTSVVTKPSGLAVGDLMIAVMHGDKAGFSAPGGQGWTRLLTQDASVNTWRMEVWYVVATSTHTAATNFTWTCGDAGSPFHAAIYAYRGVSQTSPINTWNINAATTTNPQSTPNLTTTSSCLVVHLRTVRKASGTTAFSSGVTNERQDVSNHDTVSYNQALYDSGSQAAAGSVSGVSITASSGPVTDTFAVAIALAVGDINVTAGIATATAGGLSATAAAGQSATASKGAATAAALNPTALGGKVVLAGVAAATAAAGQPADTAKPSKGGATASALNPGLFLGTPSYRMKVVPADTWKNFVGIAQRVITVEAE